MQAYRIFETTISLHDFVPRMWANSGAEVEAPTVFEMTLTKVNFDIFFYTLKSENGFHFADDIFKSIFLKERSDSRHLSR